MWLFKLIKYYKTFLSRLIRIYLYFDIVSFINDNKCITNIYLFFNFLKIIVFAACLNLYEQMKIKIVLSYCYIQLTYIDFLILDKNKTLWIWNIIFREIGREYEMQK